MWERLLLAACVASMQMATTAVVGSNKTFCNPVNLAYRMHVRLPLSSFLLLLLLLLLFAGPAWHWDM